jgi:maltooligosyltrehalose synthase
VIVPRLLARLVQGTDLPLGHAVWAQTRIVLPECLGSLRFRNIFAGTTLQRLDVAELLAHLPVGVLLQAD